MMGNQEYTRFRIGHFNLPNKETPFFDTAAHVILADAWLDLARETGQAMYREPGEFETDLRRWVSRIAVK
jgi:hypothetical protein